MRFCFGRSVLPIFAGMDLPVVPLAAATEVADVLVDLFVVLLAAKVGDEVFKRIGQPALVGEILAGILVGPSVFGLVDIGEALRVFSELGVVLLLFWVGLETRLSDLREVGRSSVLIGIIGGAIPFGAGLMLGLARGTDLTETIFLASALVATSIGITSAVMVSVGALGTRASRAILGAAVVDDVIALLLLSIAGGLATEGEVDLWTIITVVVLALGFVAFFTLGGVRVARRWPKLLDAPRFAESPLLPAVLLCLGLAAVAAQIGLAAIIGAFLAGAIVAETKDREQVREEVAPLYAFFPPFFFALIGAQVDLETLASLSALGLLLLVTAIAFITKFAGAWLGALGLGRRDAITVGIGMIPRGEVGIVVASLGLTTGVFSEKLFAVIVGMSILTTLVAPTLLRHRLEGLGHGGRNG